LGVLGFFISNLFFSPKNQTDKKMGINTPMYSPFAYATFLTRTTNSSQTRGVLFFKKRKSKNRCITNGYGQEREMIVILPGAGTARISPNFIF